MARKEAKPKITHPEAIEKKKVMVKHLRSMYETVNTFKRSIPNSYLETLGIKLLPLDLKRPSSSINYYRPLPKSEYNSRSFGSFHPFANSDNKDEEDRSDSNDAVLAKLSNLSTIMGMLWRDDHSHTQWQRDYVIQCYREKPRLSLTEYAKLDGAEYTWITTNRIQTASEMYPHCKCVVIQDVEPDEELKRSEILPILVIMRWRMSLYYYQQHEVFPVEVLSVYGGQARILIGYFDGKHLCIQKSPIYDIGSEGLQNWILLMKWWFSDAAGDTTRLPSPQDIKDSRNLAVRPAPARQVRSGR
uniref:Uncharacterized protein n=1 Tax=Coccidioides posadasii RMSCC 3488 TaxID=454284 RepID=A0A0J6FNI5_COCPO|nr:hypothetical protein CPAG_08258 [Coccidioides posadasii RMSCC 3488]